MGELISWLASVMIVVALVCGATALLDMGMNGRYAGWAPWGLGIAVVFGITSSFLLV